MWIYWILPVISGLIGWFTNWVAVKMLFYPKIEKKVFFVTLHGIFPKRKAHLADRLGVLVAKELFSTAVIKEKINHPGMQDDIKGAIEKEIGEYISTKIKEVNPLIATLINEKRQEQLRDKITEELEVYIPKMMDKLAEKVADMDIEKIVSDKVNNFSNEKLEELLMGVMQKELKFIEIAGAVLGFLVGLLQVLLILAQERLFN